MQLEVFRDYLDFFRNKQSDHLNAMVGVGLGFIFGYFTLVETNSYILFPFTVIIYVIFTHFFGRYYYYYLLEVVVNLTMDLERNSVLEDILERDQVTFSEEDYFWARINQPWFREFSTKTKKGVIYGIPFRINNVGRGFELALCGIWGLLVFGWTFYPPPDLFSSGIICAVWTVFSLILYIMFRKLS